MEIIGYVLTGGLEHQDSMSMGTVIRPGEVQCMSAGSGVTHSEYNASGEEPVNFLQIWIQPNVYGVEPGYEQKAYHDELSGQLRLVASPDGRDNSLTIHQDACLYATRLKQGEQVEHRLVTGRTVYIHVARGKVILNNIEFSSGDGATLQEEEGINLQTRGEAEALLFDLS